VNGEQFFLGNHTLFEENNWCQNDIHPILKGLENQNKTAVLIGNQSGIMGLISISDELRAKAKQTIEALHVAGIQKTIMLTGDHEKVAKSMSKELGIDEYRADLLPHQKVDVIKSLLENYKNVAMVGDGINDAPALAAATIGISMGTAATDTALETADIALLRDDLSKIAHLKHLSFKTIRIIKQNIFIALFLKAVFFALAIPGFATLWMAVFADMGASLIVIFNGLRTLKKIK
jgi:Cd2+/Zn2+-exporting ATPase